MSSRLGSDPGGIPSETGAEAFHWFHFFTVTTHRQGRARIDSDDNDGDSGAETAAGGDDIDWTDNQGDDEQVLIFLLFFSFWCFMPKGEKIRGINNFSF